jgi:prepilin-type N-terminal cleavage/methylation domain-containing protein
MRRNGKQAFTLVEIMITVAIIGLLATIAVPSLTSAREKSQRNVCIDHLRQISGAKDQYALFNGGLAPADINALVPQILRHSPACPAGGAYTIGALGEDPICGQSALGHTI